MRKGKLSQRLVPVLLVKDMSETLAVYRRLGFELTGCHPDQQRAMWTEVVREGVALQFHIEPACGTPSEPICSGRPSAAAGQQIARMFSQKGDADVPITP